MYQEIGFAIALCGAALSIAGTLVNNLRARHRLAMKFWGIANPLMLAWGIGFLLGLWTADLGMLAFVGIYFVYTVSNWYGLLRFRGRGLP